MADQFAAESKLSDQAISGNLTHLKYADLFHQYGLRFPV